MSTHTQIILLTGVILGKRSIEANPSPSLADWDIFTASAGRSTDQLNCVFCAFGLDTSCEVMHSVSG